MKMLRPHPRATMLGVTLSFGTCRLVGPDEAAARARNQGCAGDLICVFDETEPDAYPQPRATDATPPSSNQSAVGIQPASIQ
jgi:hypothetical protein